MSIEGERAVSECMVQAFRRTVAGRGNEATVRIEERKEKGSNSETANQATNKY